MITTLILTTTGLLIILICCLTTATAIDIEGGMIVNNRGELIETGTVEIIEMQD